MIGCGGKLPLHLSLSDIKYKFFYYIVYLPSHNNTIVLVYYSI